MNMAAQFYNENNRWMHKGTYNILWCIVIMQDQRQKLQDPCSMTDETLYTSFAQVQEIVVYLLCRYLP